MTYFGLRFDFRNPAFADTSFADRYNAGLDMAEWADEMGFGLVIMSEHHCAEDGYLPSPVTMASAIAARTKRIRIQVSALIAPFYDPIRAAEELAVVDNISNGRLEVVIGYGYRQAEFDLFGKERRRRVADTTDLVGVLRHAWSGEPFEYRGQTIKVMPTPVRPGGPRILMGGSSEPAARRAAHLGDGFAPSDATVWEAYRDELEKLGKPDPGPHPGGSSAFFQLTHDPEKDWERVVPFALNEVNSYGGWLAEVDNNKGGGYTPVANAEELAKTGQYRAITPDEYLAQLVDGNVPYSVFHPMMGGIPPAMAWESLRLFENEVKPRLPS